MSLSRLAACLAVSTMLSGGAAWAADDTLRIAMTASDVPTTTGAPNNGFEGVRFLGYPVLRGADAVGPVADREAGGATAWPGHELGTSTRRY